MGEYVRKHLAHTPRSFLVSTETYPLPARAGDRKSAGTLETPRRHVALGARHAPASGSYLTASMRRSLCAPQLELRPTRRGTKPKCRIPNPNPNPRIEGTPHTLCHVHATTLPSVTEETLLVRAPSKRSLARSLAQMKSEKKSGTRGLQRAIL